MTEYHAMNEANFTALMLAVGDGHVGRESAFACNVDPTEHIHVRREGKQGAGLDSRVAITTHDAGGLVVTVYLAAEEARCLAACILNSADAVDGDTPLYYSEPTFVAPGDLDTVECHEDPEDA